MSRKSLDEKVIDTFHNTLKWTGGIVCTSLVTLPLYAGGVDISGNNQPYYADFGNIEKFEHFRDVTNEVFYKTDDVSADTFDYINSNGTNSILEKQSEILDTFNKYVENTFLSLKESFKNFENTPLELEDLEFSNWEDIIPVLMKISNTEEGKKIDTEMSELIISKRYNLLWFEEAHANKGQFYPLYDPVISKFSRDDLEFMQSSLEVTLQRINSNAEANFRNYVMSPGKTLHILSNMYRSFLELLEFSQAQYDELLDYNN